MATKKPPAKSTRGRKADPNSGRQKKAAAKAAKVAAGVEVKRGRPKKAETAVKEAALAKHRESRAAEGKAVQGRKKSETSVRSMREKRMAEKGTLKPKASPPVKRLEDPRSPSSIKKNWHKLEDHGDVMGGDSERGLEMRGKTAVTYGAEGHSKFARRTVVVGKGKDKAAITVHRHSVANADNDSYKPHHSFRERDSKDRKVTESVMHHPSDSDQTRRIRVEHDHKFGETTKSVHYGAIRKRGAAPKTSSPVSFRPEVQSALPPGMPTTRPVVKAQAKSLAKRHKESSPKAKESAYRGYLKHKKEEHKKPLVSKDIALGKKPFVRKREILEG